MRKTGFAQLSFACLIALIFQAMSAAAKDASLLPGEEWRDGLDRYLDDPELYAETLANRETSALKLKVPYRPDIDVSLLPEWRGSDQALQRAFEITRDERIYRDPKNPGARRAPWLYAVTGCYARAAHVARRLEARRLIRPGKVFVFGGWATLRLRTTYDPKGTAWWWFHVAAAYRIGDRAMILDPSVEPSRPLPLQEWITRISKVPERLSLSFCDGHAYMPSSACIGGPNGRDEVATQDIQQMLPREWSRVREAGHDPSRVLLKEPPWAPKR